LRERGLNEEAERVRAGEIMPLVAALRTASDTEASMTERLNTLFAVEAERVANAAVLAEVLIPMLAEQLRPMVTPAAVGAAGMAVPPQPAAAASAAAKPASPKPASIADFIDDMIAQERPPDRPGHGTQRRAS
jgi:hypothetical protein